MFASKTCGFQPWVSGVFVSGLGVEGDGLAFDIGAERFLGIARMRSEVCS